MRILIFPLMVAATSVTTSVGAQDLPEGRSLAFTLGIGPAFSPDYFGSENSSVGATGSLSPAYLNLGPINYSAGTDAGGFGIQGSLGYIGARKAADNPELQGLPDIDLAIEVGGGFAYTTDFTEIYAVGRYGVIGHEAFVGEIGGDLIVQPSAQLELRVGPRLFFGDDSYANTYFGIDTAAATASNFRSFEAKGGLLSRGIEASIAYDFSDNWGLKGTVNYDELMNDAAKSPIVQTTDQLGVSLVVTRKLSWTF